MTKVAPDWDFDRGYTVLKKEIPPAAWLIEWWRKRSAPCDWEATAEANIAEKGLNVEK